MTNKKCSKFGLRHGKSTGKNCTRLRPTEDVASSDSDVETGATAGNEASELLQAMICQYQARSKFIWIKIVFTDHRIIVISLLYYSIIVVCD